MANLRPRVHRIGDLIQKEVSDIIRYSVKDPRIQGLFITITSVEVNRDLSQAKIFVSELTEKHGEMEEALNAAAHFIRKELASRMKIRHIPMLSFFYDDSMEKGRKITELLKKNIPE